MYNLLELLRFMQEKEASDLHLRVGMPPIYRINGELVRVGTELVTQEDMQKMVSRILTPNQRETFEREYELDFALSVSKIGRFRVNLFKQRGTYGLALRSVKMVIPSFKELNLPKTMERIAENRRGLVLVTGITGSGKSTTLASIIDYINSTRAVNILTIEDPIEYVHRNKKSVIGQREIGSDTLSFSSALRHALREDPDVILIGEIRDAESMQIALSAADTGHLVLSTLHTLDSVQTIYRILSFFPPYQHQEVRLLLSTTLKAIISQRLIPRSDMPGRVPAVEILIGTPAICSRIIDPEKTSEIKDLIAEGAVQYGMQTFDQSLMWLYRQGKISLETALQNASNPDDFKLRVAGIVGGADRGWKEFEIEKKEETQETEKE